MFQPQFASLVAALKGAGIGADAATTIARVLTNPQHVGRSGPSEVDTTPRNLRRVTPDARRHTLPGLDFRDGDPDYRHPRLPTSEEQTEPEPPPNIQIDVAPQQVNNIAFNVAPGGFANAIPRGKAVEVGMRVKGPDRSVATLDTTSSSIVGKRIRAEADPQTGLRFFIEDTGQELIWKIQPTQQQPQDPSAPPPDPPTWEKRVRVVTNVRLEPEGLLVDTITLVVSDAYSTKTKAILTTSCPTE